MLIYNHDKEFIGIDVNDLQKLHYRSFNDLLNHCSDFADLFVKKPGYIHNFKNFNWIDFVMHSDSDESKVLVSANDKTFSATLNISTVYLKDHPGEPAYLVELLHLKSLHDGDTIPSLETLETQHHIPDELPKFDEMEPTTLVEPDPLDVPEYGDFDTLETQQDAAIYNPESPFLADIAETPHNTTTPEIPVFETPPTPDSLHEKAKHSTLPTTSSTAHNLNPEEEHLLQQHLNVDLHYRYTPQIAADELGLPVDLIEEFIGDFITQAYEFKEELFASISDQNFDNIKNLSHKLKGVAANLRIDDAFEVLTLLNTTHDIDEARTYLKYFYNTIAKLGGKEIDSDSDVTPTSTPLTEDPAPSTTISDDNTPDEENDDLYRLDVKEHHEPPAAMPVDTDASDQNDDELYSFDTLVKKDETLPALEVAINHDTIHSDPFQESDQTDMANDTQTIEEAIEPYRDIHYNQSKAAYELGIDPDFITELKDDFIMQTLTQEEAFQSALNHDDMLRYKTLALELKGVSDNLRIDDISLTLEELIKSHSTQEARHAVNQLFHYVKQL